VAKSLKTLLLICLLALPVAAVIQPVPVAHAQTSGQTEQQFQQNLYAAFYNYTMITVDNPAIVGYATKSNVSIDTAFMTPDQLTVFHQTGDISNSVFYENGQENYDALLEVPGTYYLVVYSPNAAASITGLYIINYNIDLRNSTTSVALTVTIQPGAQLTIPLHAETVGSTTKVDILGASSQAVQYILGNRETSQTAFASNDVTMTNFTVFPKVSVGYNLTLGAGLYVMAIINPSTSPAVVYFQYTIIPAYVNPYILHQGPPSPTGIAAYGIFNNSGTIRPYEIATSSIVGFADISELTAVDNGTNSPLASLQENTVLQVNDTNGASYTYWPQNVLAFDTTTPSVTYRDNVLNVTGDNAQLTNQSVIGVGTVGGIINGGIPQTYYGNYNSNYTYKYTLPQSWVLYTNETVEQGHGVLIQMGVRALDGATPNRITWFDKITIEDPNVASAAFIVNGKSYTPAGAALPIGTYYDAELVFGGGAGGMAAHFQLKANLALFYLDQTLKPFPSLYTFGDDTAEAAYNIVVSNGNGAATATSGTPYFGVLSNNFNASLTSLVSQNTKSSASVSTEYIVAGAVIAVIVVLALVVVMRRRASKITPILVAPAVQPATAFCGNCGTPVDPAVRFCPNCGAPQVRDDGGTATSQPGL